MPEYNLSAVITLNSIDLQATIEAGSMEEARAISEEQISEGKYNDEINSRAVDRDFEIDEIGEI